MLKVSISFDSAMVSSFDAKISSDEELATPTLASVSNYLNFNVCFVLAIQVIFGGIFWSARFVRSGFVFKKICCKNNNGIDFCEMQTQASLRTEKCHLVPSSAVAVLAQCSGLILHFLSAIVLFVCSVKSVKEVSYSRFNLAA